MPIDHLHGLTRRGSPGAEDAERRRRAAAGTLRSKLDAIDRLMGPKPSTGGGAHFILSTGLPSACAPPPPVQAQRSEIERRMDSLPSEVRRRAAAEDVPVDALRLLPLLADRVRQAGKAVPLDSYDVAALLDVPQPKALTYLTRLKAAGLVVRELSASGIAGCFRPCPGVT